MTNRFLRYFNFVSFPELVRARVRVRVRANPNPNPDPADPDPDPNPNPNPNSHISSAHALGVYYCDGAASLTAQTLQE